MPVQIRRQDGTIITLPISLGGGSSGKNYDDIIAKLMSNFSGPTPPLNPVKGQMWFNTIESKLYIYGGTSWILAQGSGTGAQDLIANPN